MRNILLSISVLGGIVAVGGAASAAPAPILDNPAHVQTVQYYAADWRRGEDWRRREAWRREHEWRERQEYARPALPYYGPYYAPRY